MKQGVIIALLTLFFFPVACNKERMTSEITGWVYYAGTNIPVPLVKVYIDNEITHSDEDGYYSLSQHPGNYYITAEKEGFDTFSEEIRLLQGSNEKNIKMTSTSFTTLVYGVLRGNHTGLPQSGLRVLMLNPDDSESALHDVSDREGNYYLPNVPHGERMIVVISNNVIIYQEQLELDRHIYQLDIYLPEPFTFTDPRDNNEYWALRIGDQTWMIENLAWLPEVSGPRNGSYSDPYYYVPGYFGSAVADAKASKNYNNYGVLYNWEAAIVSCPDGWHLPGDSEWQELELFLGLGTFDTFSDGARLEGEIGKKLKSETGWNNNGNGDNSSMFNVYPVGTRFDNGEFDDFGYRAALWSSTESSQVFAWGRGLGGNVHWIDRDRYDRQNGLSVRCVRN